MKKRAFVPHALERIVKGFSNHRRIQVLSILDGEPQLSLDEITDRTHINYKTASEHVRRLALSGLVYKRSDSHSVRHVLSARGKQVLKFLRTLE